jgi:hypothetical protein
MRVHGERKYNPDCGSYRRCVFCILMSPRKIMSLTTSTFYWSIVHAVQYILIASSCTILPFTFLPCFRNAPTSGYDMVVFGVIYLQSTYIPRVLQCLSTRPNWDPPPPHPQASVYLRNQGGTHSPASECVPIQTTF